MKNTAWLSYDNYIMLRKFIHVYLKLRKRENNVRDEIKTQTYPLVRVFILRLFCFSLREGREIKWFYVVSLFIISIFFPLLDKIGHAIIGVYFLTQCTLLSLSDLYRQHFMTRGFVRREYWSKPPRYRNPRYFITLTLSV